jgi:hypothetical protein
MKFGAGGLDHLASAWTLVAGEVVHHHDVIQINADLVNLGQQSKVIGVPRKESAMDNDRVKGSARVVNGRIKKAVGRAIGDTKLESRARLTRSGARSRTL